MLIMKLSILRNVRRLYQKAQLYALIRMGIIDVYQPIPGFDKFIAQRHQGTVERWSAIQHELGTLAGSAIDIGCNTGFFTFQMARKGFLCMGIESEALPYYVCNLAKEVGGFDNAVFMRAIFNEDLAEKLPTVDVTIYLSVFHHMVRRFGEEVATRSLMQLMRKTRRVMFFETGQSDENVASWSKYLPEMTPNPREWIKNYFQSLGASQVKYLGEYNNHLSPVKRCLFAVYTV